MIMWKETPPSYSHLRRKEFMFRTLFCPPVNSAGSTQSRFGLTFILDCKNCCTLSPPFHEIADHSVKNEGSGVSYPLAKYVTFRNPCLCTD